MSTTRLSLSRMLMCLAILTFLTLTACQFIGHSARSLGAETPEKAILRVHEPEMVQDFTPKVIRPLPQTEDTDHFVVVYATDNPDGGEMFNHALIEKRGRLWFFANGGGFTLHGPTRSRWLDYDESGVMSDSGYYFVVYGQTLSPDVKSVSIRFPDGDVIETPVEHDAFLVIRADAREYCSIRAHDAQGVVLAERADTHGRGQGEQSIAPDACKRGENQH